MKAGDRRRRAARGRGRAAEARAALPPHRRRASRAGPVVGAVSSAGSCCRAIRWVRGVDCVHAGPFGKALSSSPSAMGSRPSRSKTMQRLVAVPCVDRLARRAAARRASRSGSCLAAGLPGGGPAAVRGRPESGRLAELAVRWACGPEVLRLEVRARRLLVAVLRAHAVDTHRQAALLRASRPVWCRGSARRPTVVVRRWDAPVVRHGDYPC